MSNKKENNNFPLFNRDGDNVYLEELKPNKYAIVNNIAGIINKRIDTATVKCFHNFLTAVNSNLAPKTNKANGVVQAFKLEIVFGINVTLVFKKLTISKPKAVMPILIPQTTKPATTP